MATFGWLTASRSVCSRQWGSWWAWCSQTRFRSARSSFRSRPCSSTSPLGWQEAWSSLGARDPLASQQVEILEVETENRNRGVRIALRGELDLSTVGKVQDELRRVEASSPALVVLDLSKLTFLDSTGLRCLVTADERARDEGRRVVIVRGPEPVQRVFSITRLEERLEIVDDASSVP
jgi:anti-anti-sigma factor